MMKFNNKILLNKKTLLLLSGGLDSVTCIPLLQELGAEIQCLYINYGNISSTMELKSAKMVTEYYKLPLCEIKINIPKTFAEGEILGRNVFFIFTALLSQQHDIDIITMGIHSGTPYYDSSLLFVKRVQILLEELTAHKISLFMPFIEWNKLDIYRYALENNVPINLTYSCEKGTNPPCHVCNSCITKEGIENVFKK